jgi:hypothetical protein
MTHKPLAGDRVFRIQWPVSVAACIVGFFLIGLITDGVLRGFLLALSVVVALVGLLVCIRYVRRRYVDPSPDQSPTG